MGCESTKTLENEKLKEYSLEFFLEVVSAFKSKKKEGLEKVAHKNEVLLLVDKYQIKVTTDIENGSKLMEAVVENFGNFSEDFRIIRQPMKLCNIEGNYNDLINAENIVNGGTYVIEGIDIHRLASR